MINARTVVLSTMATAMLAASPAVAQTAAQLAQLSIEDLANIPVTTVSRREQSLAVAPAAAYVITHDQIVRSGAQTLPDILRLAPNLFVAQTSASSWQIGARGLTGNPALQSFSNKLLVLVDGRSVYTPLFSGVYWDLQDVLPEDIDHIEVISGPAGTLWGANAVDGVVNIITRNADQTRGVLVTGTAGGQEDSLGVRYGGKLGSRVNWRVYAHANRLDQTVTSTGADAHDAFWRVQGGFRVDWAASQQDQVSLHGDLLTGRGDLSGEVDGGNLVGRWSHAFAPDANLQVQAYVDREKRGPDLTGGLPLGVTTYDLDVQQDFKLGPQALVVGGDFRSARYRINTKPNFGFVPATGALNLGSLFLQDTIPLSRTIRLIAGLKLENDPYSGWSAMPNARLSWSPDDHVLLWASVSRAVRSPTPFDTSVFEDAGGQRVVNGNPDFATEKLTAYEAGLRMQPLDRLSFTVNGYYNHYDDLRTIELSPGGHLPFFWGNKLGGYTYGMEAWTNVQATRWWRLGASLNLLSEHFAFDPGATTPFLGVAQLTDDPKVQAKLTSSMTAGRLSWDAELRYQGELPNPRVPAYTELNTRIAWALNDHLELSIGGYNLLHSRHLEFVAPPSNAVPRSIVGGFRWRF